MWQESITRRLVRRRLSSPISFRHFVKPPCSKRLRDGNTGHSPFNYLPTLFEAHTTYNALWWDENFRGCVIARSVLQVLVTDSRSKSGPCILHRETQIFCNSFAVHAGPSEFWSPKMRLLTINLNLITQNTLKDFVKTRKYWTICFDLPADKSETSFYRSWWMRFVS